MKLKTPNGFEIKEAYLIDYYTDTPADKTRWSAVYEKDRSSRFTMAHIRRHIKPPLHIPGDWGKYWDEQRYSTILTTSNFEIAHVNRDFGKDQDEFPLMLFLADWSKDEIYLASKTAMLLITATHDDLDMVLMYPMTDIYASFKAYKKYYGNADYSKYPFITALLAYNKTTHEIIDPLHRDEPEYGRSVSLMLRDQNPLTTQVS